MYKEANPAVFAIVTFPFLFGVMFGDIGHGTLLLLVGIILCIISDKLKNTALEAFAMIKYLILLMGIFATFNGVIYNEFFAIPTNIFSSCYEDEVKVLSTTLTSNNQTTAKDFGYMRTHGVGQSSCVYPLGFDARWFESDQLLSYTNNFKMKTAVIFAIVQMSLGILMKGFNSLHFKNGLDFCFEFIPQLVLLLALFGWMDILIIGKWLTEKNIDQIYPENSP
jgi:V-type H+-transporting ATPase subunit a